MRQPLGIVLMVVGGVLLVLGFMAADSLASEISEFFTGNPTDRAVWLILGGVAALATGLGAMLLPGRRARA